MVVGPIVEQSIVGMVESSNGDIWSFRRMVLALNSRMVVSLNRRMLPDNTWLSIITLKDEKEDTF